MKQNNLNFKIVMLLNICFHFYIVTCKIYKTKFINEFSLKYFLKEKKKN